jgi:hypothetical protein
MKVFISWSGDTSKAVAEALRDWLPLVIQAVEPWMSAHDIERGARWNPALTNQLEQTKVGIICLTPDNLKAPWILFEAGALSKTVEATFVCPFLFRVGSSDLEGPLAQFQTTKAEKDDTRELMHTINKSSGPLALRDGALDQAFEKWWQNLEKRLGGIRVGNAAANIPKRTYRQILEEILELVRNAPRTISYSVAPAKSDVEDPRLAAIKTQLFDQSKRFLSSCLDHLVGWHFENGEVVFRFAEKDKLYADLLKGREQSEALLRVCADVLGQSVRIRVELQAT